MRRRAKFPPTCWRLTAKQQSLFTHRMDNTETGGVECDPIPIPVLHAVIPITVLGIAPNNVSPVSKLHPDLVFASGFQLDRD